MAHRKAYFVDHDADFGLSGLAGVLCRRTTLRLDEPTVAALIDRAVHDDEDEQLVRDARLLLESPLPDGVLHAVWLAATRRCFDPADHGSDIRAWLRRVSDAGPVRAAGAETSGPTVTEEELREAVAAELRLLAPALTTAVAVPDLVPALERVVREADADLGFRLLLRALKAYAVRVTDEQYHRFLGLGERLDYPLAAVFEELSVHWPPLASAPRDFEFGFGLPKLSRLLDGEWNAWRYEGTGTPQGYAAGFVRADSGLVPGAQAAVLLEDAVRLLDSPLGDGRITALWRAASRRCGASEDFDADGRVWLRQVAEDCREYLAEVDPAYTLVLRPARTGLAEEVLSELRLIGPALEATGDAMVREAVKALAQVTTEADPELGFRFLLRFIDGYGITVTAAQYARYERLGERLGCGADHVRRELEPPVSR
ncbi:hypothetical protein [Streptomyces sp. T028]|uniref:hypothetical protein n=1 Tax=Streptomyces sp. T028 TaxID=3394379 RepID=UPI003A8C15DA